MFLADIPLAEGDIPPLGSITVSDCHAGRRRLFTLDRRCDFTSEPRARKTLVDGVRAHASAPLAPGDPSAFGLPMATGVPGSCRLWRQLSPITES